MTHDEIMNLLGRIGSGDRNIEFRKLSELSECIGITASGNELTKSYLYDAISAKISDSNKVLTKSISILDQASELFDIDIDKLTNRINLSLKREHESTYINNIISRFVQNLSE